MKSGCKLKDERKEGAVQRGHGPTFGTVCSEYGCEFGLKRRETPFTIMLEILVH